MQQIIVQKSELTHGDVIQFSENIKAMSCKGSDCIKEKDIDGFFKPGQTPWIGHPIEIPVGPQTDIFEVSCFSSNSLAKLQLTVSDEYDYSNYNDGYDYSNDLNKNVNFEPNEESVKGSIVEAKFKIENANSFIGKSFYCSDQHTNKESLNVANVVASTVQYSAWSNWTTCENVGADKVSRQRSTNQPTNPIETQTRYCRCSDLAVPPSPR